MLRNKLALIGENISYSLSQAIHSISAEACNIASFHYSIIDMHTPLTPSALKELPVYLSEHKITGFNITTPYKQNLAQTFVPHITPSSYNLAWLDGHKNWLFSSTDGAASMHCLRQAGIALKAIKHIIVLGYGGACHSFAQRLEKPLHKDLHLHFFWRKITTNHPSNYQPKSWLTTKLKKLGIHMSFYPFSEKHFAQTLGTNQDILILQTTPLPHQNRAMNEFAKHMLSHSSHILACHDMTYAGNSGFAYYAKEAGIPFISGLDMLIQQARLSQEIWWGKSASFELIKSQLKNHQNAK